MGKEKHSDEYYLKMALAEANKGRFTTSPNPAVGCVIVRNSKILGMGYHHCAGQPHAEIMALKAADYDVKDATVYVTLEPCSHYGRTPPCAKALCDAGVSRVVIGSSDPNPKVAGRGVKILEEAGIEVTLATGKINKQCIKLNRAFFKSIQSGRPFTILKYGMSLDGKVALSTGESKWITNDRCRADVQRLRLWSDALITSHKTITSDNPKLNVRLEDVPIKLLTGLDTTLVKQPIKVIVDSHAQLLPNLKLKDLDDYAIFTSGENYIVVGTNEPLSDPNAVVTAVAKGHDPLEILSGCDCESEELHESMAGKASCRPKTASAKATKASTAKSASKTTSSKAAATKSTKAAASKAASAKTSAAKDAKSTAPKASASKKTTTKAVTAKATASKTTAAKAAKSATTKATKTTATKATKATASKAAKSTAKVRKADRKSAQICKSVKVTESISTKSSAVGAEMTEAQLREGAVNTSSWHINQKKVIARGSNFAVEKWSDRVYIVAVPFVKGEDGRDHASLNAVLDFLGSKEIRVAMVEAGSNLGSSFLEQGLIDECYCYIAPMILGQDAKSAFAVSEPKRLAQAMQFDKCKVRTFGDNIGLVLTKPRRSKK